LGRNGRMRAAGDVKGNGKNEIVIEWTRGQKREWMKSDNKKESECLFVLT